MQIADPRGILAKIGVQLALLVKEGPIEFRSAQYRPAQVTAGHNTETHHAECARPGEAAAHHTERGILQQPQGLLIDA